MSEKRESDRTVGAYVGSIVGTAIVMFLVNKLPDWNLRFITGDYPAVLWAMNLSLLVQLAGNAVLVFLHPRFLHYLMQTVFSVFSLLALIVITSVFPLDFSHLAGGVINTVFRVILIVATVATAIGAVVNLLKAVGSLVRRPRERPE